MTSPPDEVLRERAWIADWLMLRVTSHKVRIMGCGIMGHTEALVAWVELAEQCRRMAAEIGAPCRRGPEETDA